MILEGFVVVLSVSSSSSMAVKDSGRCWDSLGVESRTWVVLGMTIFEVGFGVWMKIFFLFVWMYSWDFLAVVVFYFRNRNLG